MKLKGFLKRRNSKRPIVLLFLDEKDDEITSIWYDNVDEIEENYLNMEVMDYTKEDDCTEIWLK